MESWVQKLRMVDIDDELLMIKERGTVKPKGPPERRILDYMNGGLGVGILLRPAIDIISKNEETIGTSAIMTDGEWVWSSIDLYYIEKYSVRVPNDFYEHMKSKDFQCPALSEIQRRIETLRHTSNENSR